jgi:methylated-DNA-protein-cysteine methyltransferase related protein
VFDEILAVVRRIPRGKVSTYGAVARAAGFPGAARQVAWALRSGSDPSIPWHRVVGAKGAISLPGESGFEQQMRLAREGVAFIGRRVNMRAHEFVFSPAMKSKKQAPRSAAKRNP